MIHAPKVLVIGGSVRPRRLCLQIADWAVALGREVVDADFEVIDLRDWPLPMDREPNLPHRADYESDATRAWSRKVQDAQGVVLVTPQYNWGYPAPLKNALDQLYPEWAGKPAMIVTYGGHGGDRCARQLREVLKGLHMKPIRPAPRLRLARQVIEADSGAIDPGQVFAGQAKAVRGAFRDLGRRLSSGC